MAPPVNARIRGLLPAAVEVAARVRAGLREAGRPLLQWIVLGHLVGIACGVATAIFLISLDQVTAFRIEHQWIVFLLPVAGIGLGLVYDRWGRTIRAGNNLVIDTIHEASPKVPLRMAPMVLLGTLVTHLFGGSAGREGTAVQMGASLADSIAHRLRLGRLEREGVLAAGIAGGFGAAFGTPIAGVVFGLEVLTIGRIEYAALLPALISAVVADLVARSLGVVHAAYPVVPTLPMSAGLLVDWLVFGVVVAIVAVGFVESSHRLRGWLERRIPSLPLRMMTGGIAVVAMWQLVGTDRYLGLGLPTIVGAFTDTSIPLDAFALKLVFTVVTLAAGFIGGEVTPLLFVGATLGAAYGQVVGLPMELTAGVGLVAVFGAAANTPIALTIMGVELAGAGVLPHVAIVTVVAYLLTGHRGIYPAQRIVRLKHGGPLLERLAPLREGAPPRAAPAAPPPGASAAEDASGPASGAPGRTPGGR